MQVDVIEVEPAVAAADLLALPLPARPAHMPETVRQLDELLGGTLSALASADGAKPGAVTILYTVPAGSVAAPHIAIVGVGDLDAFDEDTLRTAVAASVRAACDLASTVAWPVDPYLPLSAVDQVHAAVEGAVLGAYDPGRWKTSSDRRPVERLLLCGGGEGLRQAAARAELVARWTNRARELVDAPPNELNPAALAETSRSLLAALPVEVEALDATVIEQLGMGALMTVARGSAAPPRLLVLRYRPAGSDPTARLGLVGKAVTFDSGGYFLKGQSDIIRQKADMAGGAAVVCAAGAIAELGLPLDVVAVVPACENMLGGAAFRPGDILTTAAGLTVEVTNPDAEGRLILADALWYARREAATRLIDLATLTGAMRAGMGDLYAGVFANDEDWRGRVVAAGAASGDHAWPWPLHPRYASLLESRLADLRNTAGRSFGYPIIAAAFLQHFVGELPWAHVDMHSTAFLDEERHYLRPGASGYGVRLLVELAAAETVAQK
jgi:leucyl aminopeptidase